MAVARLRTGLTILHTERITDSPYAGQRSALIRSRDVRNGKRGSIKSLISRPGIKDERAMRCMDGMEDPFLLLGNEIGLGFL